MRTALLVVTIAIACLGALASSERAFTDGLLYAPRRPAVFSDLHRAHELSSRARRELDAGRNAQAFITARLGYRELRKAVTETMTCADSRFDAVPETKRHLCYLYWSLPRFFAAKEK